jgi:hypothetical protein
MESIYFDESKNIFHIRRCLHEYDGGATFKLDPPHSIRDIFYTIAGGWQPHSQESQKTALIPILNNNRYKLLDKRLGLAQAMAWQENERN